MKYCVIKDTATVVDGSENPAEVMALNAENAGITSFEILAEEEFEARKTQELTPTLEPTTEERLEALEMAMLDMILGGGL